ETASPRTKAARSLSTLFMPGLLAETIIVNTHASPDVRQNRLVPQGGFEPSTYRLRSDCSAVELLRRPQREPCSKEARPCRSAVLASLRSSRESGDPESRTAAPGFPLTRE